VDVVLEREEEEEGKSEKASPLSEDKKMADGKGELEEEAVMR